MSMKCLGRKDLVVCGVCVLPDDIQSVELAASSARTMKEDDETYDAQSTREDISAPARLLSVCGTPLLNTGTVEGVPCRIHSSE